MLSPKGIEKVLPIVTPSTAKEIRISLDKRKGHGESFISCSNPAWQVKIEDCPAEEI
jgi:hypothetical protein